MQTLKGDLMLGLNKSEEQFADSFCIKIGKGVWGAKGSGKHTSIIGLPGRSKDRLSLQTQGAGIFKQMLQMC